MIAFVSLPEVNTPVQEYLTNMNGYWNPPHFVRSFWCNCMKIEYNHPTEYQIYKGLALYSYRECLKQFYRENAL